jgi:hypothetical protein
LLFIDFCQENDLRLVEGDRQQATGNRYSSAGKALRLRLKGYMQHAIMSIIGSDFLTPVA